MRSTLACAVLAAAVLFGVSAAQAYTGKGPWCAVVNTGFNSLSEDCSFGSFEACRGQVIAGNRGFCNPNSRYTGPMEPAKRPAKRQVQAR